MNKALQINDDPFGDGFEADDDLVFSAAHDEEPPLGEPVADPFGAPAERPSGTVEILPVAGGGSENALQFTPPATYNPVGDLLADMQSQLGEVSVPRISIHVFGERQDTAEAAEKAAADRRLSRASTTVRLGGVATAMEVYRHEPTPALIIVENHAPAARLLVELDQLAQVCDPGTKVVVVGAANDIALYRELMRRGVSEYLVAPIQPLQLIGVIGSLYADPAAPFVGKTIAFVGARGGVGASTVAHNTAYAVSERMMSETVVVDYDLAFGTAGLDFNQDTLQGVAEALTQPDRLDQVLLDRMMVRCTDRLSLLPAPATLDSDWDVSPEAYEEVTQQIRGTAPFVVLDLPHSWSSWMRRTLITADEVVIVASPDLASLRNGKNIVDLVRSARPNDSPPRLVLNQVGLPGRPEIPIKDFANALGVAPCLVLPFDAKLFGAAANNGQMILEVGAKSKPAEGFNHLAQVLTGREIPLLPPPSSGGPKSILSKIFKR